MPSPRFEIPSGSIDGSNTVFTVTMSYSPGSTAVFLNGILQAKGFDDGWIETSPDAGTITMKEAPRPFDVVQIFFLDRSAPLPETQIQKLKGIVRSPRTMRAELRASVSTRVVLTTSQPLVGQLDQRKDLRGSISMRPSLKGYIKECI